MRNLAKRNKRVQQSDVLGQKLTRTERKTPVKGMAVVLNPTTHQSPRPRRETQPLVSLREVINGLYYVSRVVHY